MFNEIDDGLFILSNQYTVDNSSDLNLVIVDLDHTLIKTKSGKKYPKDQNDWIFAYDSNNHNYDLITVLKSFRNNNYHIIIITNQKGISLGIEKKDKIFNKIININKTFKKIGNFSILTAFVLTKDDIYRKPYPYSIKKYNMINNFNINKEKSLFIGDAAGRNSDHSAADHLFAINYGIIYFIPEDIFKINSKTYNLAVKNNLSKSNYDYKSYCNQFNIPIYEKYINVYTNYINNNINNKEIFKEIIEKYNNDKVLIILTGSPGSGKSTLYYNYFFNNGYKRINNDELKSTAKKEFKKYIDSGYKIVIDNTNCTNDQRKFYIEIGKQNNYKIIGVKIMMNKSLAIILDSFREINIFRNHYTKKVGKVPIHTYYKNFEELSDKDFDAIYNINFEFITNSNDEIEFLNNYLDIKQ